MDRPRVAMSSSDVIDDYFNLVGQHMTSVGLQHHPERIWNCDEVGFGKDTEKTKQKIIAPKGQKNPYRQQVIASEHITMLACANAKGKYIPNALIYKTCLPNGRYADSIPADWLYAATESGYINREIFERWFIDIFVPSINTSSTNLLILDNHESHMSPNAIDVAIQNNVDIIALPAHTSHFLQPLDQIFNNLKVHLSDLAQSLGILSADTVIRKNRMAQLLKYAMERAWTADVVQKAFTRTGLYPLCKDAIDKSFVRTGSDKDSSENSSENDETESGDPAPCKECGHVQIPNPLVAAGIVSEELQDILIPPSLKDKETTKQKGRRITKARILTGKEMQEVFRQKEESDRNKQSKPSRKRKSPTSTEEEISEKENNTNEETLPDLVKPKKRKSSKSDELAPPEYTCGICNVRGLLSDEDNGIVWVGCDNNDCAAWIHYDCLDHQTQTDVDLSILCNMDWTCPLCFVPAIVDQRMCVVCMTDLPGDTGIFISCSVCDADHHYECLPERLQREADLSLSRPNAVWLCNVCKSSPEQ